MFSRPRLPMLAIAALLLLPCALAETTGGVDATVALAPGAPPSIEGREGLVRLVDSEPGERYVFALSLEDAYTTFELRLSGFDVERPRQMVPSLVVNESTYPLFHAYPNERVWEADGPARVFHVSGAADAIVLRLGVDGPGERTLVLERDVTPPTFTLGEVSNVTPIGFYQETRTDELALADLQVRKAGSEDVVQNPTPAYHVLQRFPIQGLDPAQEYVVQAVFTDWAGNEATSEPYTVRTPARPVAPPPTIVVLAPEPSTTLAPENVTVRARLEPASAPITPEGVRLFFDKREVTQALRFAGDEVVYEPPAPLARGRHSVSIEVADEAGGEAVKVWSFDVGDPAGSAGAPLGPLVAIGALILAARRPRAP